MDLDVFALTIIFLAFGAGSFVKGMTGSGLPPIVVPIVAIFLGVETAVVVIQIPNLISNIWLVWGHRTQFSRTKMRYDMFISSAITVAIGVWFLSAVDKQITLILLAFVLASFLAFFWVKPDYKLDGRTGRVVVPVASLFGGFSQGATGISGPVFSPLLFSLKLDKEPFVLYNGLLFGFFNVIQIATMIWLGMFTTERLLWSLAALLPLAIFQVLGMKMTSRVSLTTFRKIIIAVLVLLEGKLLWDAFAG